MGTEKRIVVFDEALQVEAYRLTGVAQSFPSHFHDYYVIGLIERGQRQLLCGNREYLADAGSIVLFAPGQAHACTQTGEQTLDYRGLNISREMMLELAQESTGRRMLPDVQEPVLRDEALRCCLQTLHERILAGTSVLEREEQLLLFLSALLRQGSRPEPADMPAYRQEVERACRFMEAHAAERVSLDAVCRHAGLSKSALLRAFPGVKGVTPYRYLETIRIGAAKKLLEQGVAPAEAALRTGFSDQSHFTRFFTRFIGLTPGAYREIFLKRETGKAVYDGTE